MGLFSKKEVNPALEQHKADIQQCCSQFKYKLGHFDKQAINDIAAMMTDDETPVFAYGVNVAAGEPQGKIDSKISIKDKDPGLLVVTNLRIIFMMRIGSQTSSKVIYLSDIETVDSRRTSVIFGITVLRVQTRTTALAIDCGEKELKALEQILNDAVLKSHSSAPVSAPTQQVSAADEIKKYKDLLDAGAITQEEFDAKKKQLLGL